jgi:Conjugal transfer protein TraD
VWKCPRQPRSRRARINVGLIPNATKLRVAFRLKGPAKLGRTLLRTDATGTRARSAEGGPYCGDLAAVEPSQLGEVLSPDEEKAREITMLAHTREQGFRVHHLTNPGDLIALAGLDLEPPDLLLGVLLPIANGLSNCSAEQRRHSRLRAAKSWMNAPPESVRGSPGPELSISNRSV